MSMHMIRLWREFLFNSDGDYAIMDPGLQGGKGDIQADGGVSGNRVALEFASDTDVEGDGQTELQVYFAARQTLKLMATLETLALRKELGSWSDVTGSARCWNRVMVKCEILTKGLGLASSSRIEPSCLRYGMTDIEADGVGSETLALRKELGFLVLWTGSARCWNRVGEAWVTSMFQFMHMIRLWREFMYNSDGYRKHYVDPGLQGGKGDIQADGGVSGNRSALGLGLCNSKADGNVRDISIRKELGSWSDVTGSARCWNRVMVKCEILTKGLGLALVVSCVYGAD
ncbi:Ubiquitin Carboxyl-Terminal Hydrolase 49 [Manis pentadactyla]|nr:Ubiquitin Carboxyl-Terminal Hydrolase 49 [Manis pentadactyla]